MAQDVDEAGTTGAAAPPAGRLRAMFLVLAVLCLGVLVAGAVHRELVRRLPHFYEDDDTARQEELVAGLPGMLRTPGPLGLIIGSSTMFRLSPRLIDRDLHADGIELSTFNLAMNGAGTDQHVLMLRRLRAAMPSPPRRIAVAILDVSLVLMTVRGRATLDARNEIFIGLQDPAALWSLAHARPAAAFDAAFRKYALGEKHYGDLTTLWETRVLNRAWSCRLQPQPGSPPSRAQALKDYCELERTLLPDGHMRHWDPANAGFDLPAPDGSIARFAALMGIGDTPDPDAPPPGVEFARHRAELVENYDFLELHFDEPSVETLVGVARELATYSDHVVFVLSPESPLVSRSAAAEQRVQALIARLKTVSPDVVDLRRDARFVASDFRDALHITFAPSALAKYAAAVAEGVRRAFGATADAYVR